jgi:hypothetical protein
VSQEEENDKDAIQPEQWDGKGVIYETMRQANCCASGSLGFSQSSIRPESFRGILSCGDRSLINAQNRDRSHYAVVRRDQGQRRSSGEVNEGASPQGELCLDFTFDV